MMKPGLSNQLEEFNQKTIQGRVEKSTLETYATSLYCLYRIDFCAPNRNKKEQIWEMIGCVGNSNLTNKFLHIPVA